MDNQSNHTSQSEKESRSNQIPWWVTSICIVTAVGAVSYKFVIGNFNIDFNAFLSLVLALFSIFLSAMFYFKATDTSNKFYDNIYKFTKDIAELLVRIESGFGQQLKSIDERQLKMNDWVYNGKMSEQERETTESEITKQSEELARISSEKQKIIDKLIEDAKIDKDEKEKIKAELSHNKDKYLQARQALTALQAKLDSNDEIDDYTNIKCGSVVRSRSALLNKLARYSHRVLFNKFGWIQNSNSKIPERFNAIQASLPAAYLRDMQKLGFFEDGKLTITGANFLNSIGCSMEHGVEQSKNADEPF